MIIIYSDKGIEDTISSMPLVFCGVSKLFNFNITNSIGERNF